MAPSLERNRPSAAAPLRDRQHIDEILATRHPHIVCARQLSRPAMILAMALGYFCLLVLLASAPIWGDALLSDGVTALACGDAGGL